MSTFKVKSVVPFGLQTSREITNFDQDSPRKTASKRERKLSKNLFASTSRLHNPSMWASETQDLIPYRYQTKSNSSSLIVPLGPYKGIPFEKYPNRKSLFPIIAENTFAPLYNPNKEFSKIRLNKLCVPFGMLSGRVNFQMEETKKNLPFNIGKTKSKNEPISCLLLSYKKRHL